MEKLGQCSIETGFGQATNSTTNAVCFEVGGEEGNPNPPTNREEGKQERRKRLSKRYQMKLVG